MESFKVIGKIEDPSKYEGACVAIDFDYGIVSHPIYGDAHLNGLSPCFEPFVDLSKQENGENEKSVTPKMTMEMVMTMAGCLEKCGYEVTLDDPMMNDVSENTSFELIQVYSRLYPDAPKGNFKMMGAMTLFIYFVEETFDTWRLEGVDPRMLVEIYSAALDGNVTHLSQVPSLPKNLQAPLAATMVLRKECLTSTVPQGWLYLQQECKRFLEAMYNEQLVSTETLEEYQFQRIHTNGTALLIECLWMYLDIDVPNKIRFNPAYHQYIYSLGLYQGLLNDIASLVKEIKGGESHNVILFLTRSMTFQNAIDASVRLLEEQFYKAKDAARMLLKAFPGNSLVPEMVTNCGRASDLLFPLHEAFEFRFQIINRSSYVVIQFNDVYEEKEKKLQDALTLENLQLGPTKDQLMAEIEAATAVTVTANQQDCIENDCIENVKTRYKNNVSNGITKSVEHQNLTSAVKPVIEDRSIEEELKERAENFKIRIDKKLIKGKNEILSFEAENQLVKHMGLIPDGNRRWARSQGIPTFKGHWAGADAIEKIVTTAFDLGVHTVTVWVLSASNFKRPKAELENLRELVRYYYNEFKNNICQEYDARLVHVGKKDRLPEDMLEVINRGEMETMGRNGHRINIGIDYDGREDIAHAVDKIKSSNESTIRPSSPEEITQNLWGGDQQFPEPDLIVRTGAKDAGTYRTSGFMIWQAANTEFYFEDKYLPEVEAEDVKKWLEEYGRTEKRLGL